VAARRMGLAVQPHKQRHMTMWGSLSLSRGCAETRARWCDGVERRHGGVENAVLRPVKRRSSCDGAGGGVKSARTMLRTRGAGVRGDGRRPKRRCRRND
jgi:hypothetical protein